VLAGLARVIKRAEGQGVLHPVLIQVAIAL
jgi:hypothetical protein